MSQPGGKGVLGSWGQSQLPELVLLDVLMAPSISAHLGGAACLCLVQAGLQTVHGAQGHADVALHASFPCCYACYVVHLLRLCLFPLLLLGDPGGSWLNLLLWDQVLPILSLVC